MIVERIQLYVRNEIKKYLRRQNDETSKIQGELTECKKRLSKLESDISEGDENTIFRWLDRMRNSGATLKTLRKKLGISQTELAILLDTNPATVNRWESGRVRLSRKSCEKIARIRSLNAAEAHRALQEKHTHKEENCTTTLAFSGGPFMNGRKRNKNE